MLVAIHAAAGPENEGEARDLALDWCSRWNGGDNPNESTTAWDSLKPPHRIGWDYIAQRASAHGFNSAAYDFAADPNARPSTLPPPPADRGPTDMGNAGRFARAYRSRLCYVGGGWLVWDGKRYAPIDPVEVERMAKVVVRDMYAEASRIDNQEKRTRLVGWAHKSETAERISGMVRLARGELARRLDEFDNDLYALTVENGIIDLRAGHLRTATADEAVRLLAGTHYDADADAPLWGAFLETIFEGDRELVSYVQRLCGYVLTGDTKEQMLAFLHGDGANGKSTFLETLRAVLGEYAAQAPFSQFVANARQSSGSASPEIMRLRGKRAVMASESRRGVRLDETQVKSLTGGDTIVGRELYKSHQEFRPQFKLLGAVNHKPELPADDPAVWRRMHLVPFAVTIPAEARDPDLPTKLRAELPGILAWMVRGCLEWQRQGLNPPAAVLNATASYRAEMDEVARFIHEECDVRADAESGATELYEAFQSWCTANAESAESLTGAMSQREFGQRVSHHDPGRIRKRKSSNTIYVGIRPKRVASARAA
jgi:putative DNA primase/helicase